ncbi:Holliday junction resolvase RuvX [Candidatus Dependentiae bacterium HGW-Dependentiae-1]|nr:MAG: Holliday junction resolvase RuvX [Candidatus Dependentiae bacterium HGW-Dependentiae-1]
MKILALDIGDQWTGVAISDAIGMLARPYTTVLTDALIPFLGPLCVKEKIQTVVLGYPITMRGTISEQTEKVIRYKKKLELEFPTLIFVFQDERLSSKHATGVKKAFTKEDKISTHARAAAFILTCYLERSRK